MRRIVNPFTTFPPARFQSVKLFSVTSFPALMLPADGTQFEFLPGEYRVEVYASLVGRKQPLLLLGYQCRSRLQSKSRIASTGSTSTGDQSQGATTLMSARNHNPSLCLSSWRRHFAILLFRRRARSRPFMVKPPLRTKSIGFKVSEEEYARLETAAQADGRTLGEWCR